MRYSALMIPVFALCILARAQTDSSEAQLATLKQFVDVHKTNALAKGWQLGCNGFRTPENVAISFTYQSELSGTNSDALNAEMIRRWPEIEALASQSGMTQAMVLAKVNKSLTPVEWQSGQCLMFARGGDGEWLRTYVCHTNIPPVSVNELRKVYDAQPAAGGYNSKTRGKPER